MTPTLICASLLYAAEINGLYAGIPWKANVEDEIEIKKPSLIRGSEPSQREHSDKCPGAQTTGSGTRSTL